MCSYREKKSEPTEMMQLDGYTVDYIEPVTGILFIATFLSQIVIVEMRRLRFFLSPADIFHFQVVK